MVFQNIFKRLHASISNTKECFAYLSRKVNDAKNYLQSLFQTFSSNVFPYIQYFVYNLPIYAFKVKECIFKTSCIIYECYTETISFPRNCLFHALSPQLKYFLAQLLYRNCENIIEVKSYLFIFDMFLWMILPLPSTIIFRMILLCNAICSIYKYFYQNNNYTSSQGFTYKVVEE